MTRPSDATTSTGTRPGFDTWRCAWSAREIRRDLLLTVPVLAATLFALSRFLMYIERRPGVVLADPVLALIPAWDASWITFGLIYGSIVLAVISLVPHPAALLLVLRAYIVLLVVRMAAMAVIPLDPPAGMIPLVDPLASFTTGATLSRDLFFSGHTSTIFLLFLTARHRVIRTLFLLCAIGVGVLVLVQHCHYTIDVLAAPFFAYTCYRIALLMRRPESPESPR